MWTWGVGLELKAILRLARVLQTLDLVQMMKDLDMALEVDCDLDGQQQTCLPLVFGYHQHNA